MLAILLMKQYVIDELRFQDYENIKSYLDKKFGPADLGGIYWITLDEQILTGIQAEHTQCHPYYFAVELEEIRISFELLVRTKNRVRCGCMGYATPLQLNWLISFIDSMFNEIGIII